MCKLYTARLIIAGLACVIHATAANTFTGGLRDSVSVSGNWSSGGLPIGAENAGTISSAAGWDAASTATLTNYHLNLTGGVLTRYNFASEQTIDGGVWEFNGGLYFGRSLNLINGAKVTVNLGGVRAVENSNDDIILADGASLTINGGMMAASDMIGIKATGGTLTINGGTVTSTKFAANFRGGGTYHLNGGTINGGAFGADTAEGILLNLGPGDAGTASFASFNPTGVTIDWALDSRMALTIANSDRNFYEALYRRGSLLLAGSNENPFGDAFAVSDSTLKRVGIPEVSAWPLFSGMLALGGVLLRRRR
jgi:hypothetical protein